MSDIADTISESYQDSETHPVTEAVDPHPRCRNHCACEQPATHAMLPRLVPICYCRQNTRTDLSQVRCSGEKTGCARCLEYGKHCEYLLSMVGRSSARNKQARARLIREGMAGSSDAQASVPASAPAPVSVPAPAPAANIEPVTTFSETSPNSPASTNPLWSSSSVIVSNNDHVTPPTERSPSTYASNLPPWLKTPESNDPLLNFFELNDPSMVSSLASSDGLSELNHDEFANDEATANPMTSGNAHAEPDCDDFMNDDQTMHPRRKSLDSHPSPDQHSIPDISDLIHDPSIFATSAFEQPNSMHSSSSTQPQEVTELSGVLHQSNIENTYPHIYSLGRIIGLLEGHIQNKATAVDEVMRVNKACMTEIAEIMNTQFFRRCKSCRMLVLTAMDLVITLYELGVSEDVKSTSHSSSESTSQARTQKASLQFGVFQFEPEDHAMFRNQIVRNELERCIQVIQGQSSELRTCSGDRSTPSHKVHQNWFSVIESRARVLASSLREEK